MRSGRRRAAGGAVPREAPLQLFVAIELPDDVKAALGEAMALLRRAGLDGGLRWVRPEGIHLTLKFLGATPEPRVPAITIALREALAGVPALALRPKGIGTFPALRDGAGGKSARSHLRAVWAGVAGETDALSALAARVDATLAPLGYPAETRPYFAHLTLARVRDDAGAALVAQISDGLRPYVLPSGDAPELPAFPAFRAERVSLMQSTLGPGGAQYRALQTFELRP